VFYLLRTYFKAKSNAENVIKQGMKITLIAKGSLGVVPSAQPCAQRSNRKTGISISGLQWLGDLCGNLKD